MQEMAQTTTTIRSLRDPEPERSVRVLVLDRDSGFVTVLVKRIAQAGWQHEWFRSVSAGKLMKVEADVVVVDISILGERRWTWLKEVCALRPDLRVIVCTGPSSVRHRVAALRIGADDWLTKPCHPEELLARIGAVLRFNRPLLVRSLEPITVGEIEVRPDRYQAYVRGRSVQLTPREYHLLELMALNHRVIMSRTRIYSELWGREPARNSRSVDVCIYNLRRKLDLASPEWSYIETHYRLGYRLDAQRVRRREVNEICDADQHDRPALAA
jgi:DNA-binding response OmpR family regulator